MSNKERTKEVSNNPNLEPSDSQCNIHCSLLGKTICNFHAHADTVLVGQPSKSEKQWKDSTRQIYTLGVVSIGCRKRLIDRSIHHPSRMHTEKSRRAAVRPRPMTTPWTPRRRTRPRRGKARPSPSRPLLLWPAACQS